MAATFMGAVGLLAVFAPFLSRLQGLGRLHFRAPLIFHFFAEIATLGTFLAVIFYRQWLHYTPPFGLGIGVSLVFFLLIFLIALIPKVRQRFWTPALALLLYSLAVVFLVGDLSRWSVESTFHSISGRAAEKGTSTPATYVTVYAIRGNETQDPVFTRTNSSGSFKLFFLDKEFSYLTEIRVGSSERKGSNFRYIVSNSEDTIHYVIPTPIEVEP